METPEYDYIKIANLKVCGVYRILNNIIGTKRQPIALLLDMFFMFGIRPTAVAVIRIRNPTNPEK